VGATLRRLGHDVEPVADGRGAVEAYQQAIARGQPFDLVLLDLTVRAGTGGKEAIELLFKLDPDVKAIVMSGYANDPVLLEPERYGFRDVLVKPFDTASLRKALARVLDRAEDH
jgi:CheY-like chemotaxis protein